MVNWLLTKKLLRDLWQRKLTIIAVILVLTVGVGCYGGMAGVYNDLNLARANYYQQYNLADFTLDLKRAATVAVPPLIKTPNILRLRPRVKMQVMTQLPAKSFAHNSHLIPGIVMSLPVPKRDIINNIRLVSGTWFSSPYAREIIINQQFAQQRHLNIGDRIEVRLPDKQYKLLIVGTVTSPEYVSIIAPGTLAPDPGGYAIMYMPNKFLQQATNLNGSFNQLLGMVYDKSPIAVKNTMTLLSDKLDNYGVQLQTAQNNQLSTEVLHDELINIKKTTSFLPPMFLLVAILILNVMISRLVQQQRGIIGTLKALGYSNFAILRHYIGFGFIIGILGGLLGAGLGFMLQYSMLEMYKTFFAMPNMITHIYPHIFIYGLLSSVISALIGAIFGGYKATQLAPAEAMRPPVPEKGAHIFVEKITLLWKHLSFQGKMVMRAIFRNRFRSLVTLFASIIATALVFSALTFLDSIDKMIGFSFEKMQHQDYNLLLRDPLGPDILRTAAMIPEVKKVEGQLTVAAELTHGPFQKRIEATGLPASHTLFTPVDRDGNTISISTTGIVINDTLAHILHVKTGDKITLKPLIGNRTSTKVKIIRTFRSYLGLNAYANQTWLSRLLGDSYVANHILFKLNPDANITNFKRATGKFAPMINLTSTEQMRATMTQTFDQFLVFVVFVLIGFAGTIAMGSVLNTAMISLNERERDVASLRVLGFTSLQTAKIFFYESIILNFIGIFLGLFMGIYFAYYMSIAFSTEIYRMPFVITDASLTKTAIIMVTFVLISQLIIYQIIRKLRWFDVLNTRE